MGVGPLGARVPANVLLLAGMCGCALCSLLMTYCASPGAFLAVSPVAWYGIFPATSDAGGRVVYPLPLPPVPGIAGVPLLSQWFVNDPAAPNGVGNVSDAYEFHVQP